MKYRVNGPAVAGYVLWATLVGWYVSPASPTWPETIVSAPLILVAVYLVAWRPGQPS